MELLETLSQWPIVVPSGLLALAIVYWLLVIVGAADIELFDLDFDTDMEVDGDLDGDLHGGTITGISGLGLVVLRFLNIGQVPLMIWGSIFAILFWTVTMMLWDFWDNQEAAQTILGGGLLLLRNLFVAALLSKVATNPMRKWFRIDKGPTPAQMIGETCELTTDLRPEMPGQARFHTAAAPRLLTVRTEKCELHKGDTVELARYDKETKTFWVKRPDEVNDA